MALILIEILLRFLSEIYLLCLVQFPLDDNYDYIVQTFIFISTLMVDYSFMFNFQSCRFIAFYGSCRIRNTCITVHTTILCKACTRTWPIDPFNKDFCSTIYIYTLDPRDNFSLILFSSIS